MLKIKAVGRLFAIASALIAGVLISPTVAYAINAIMIVTLPVVSTENNEQIVQGQTTPQLSITTTLQEGTGGSLPFWRMNASGATDGSNWRVAVTTPILCPYSSTMAAGCVSITIDGSAPPGNPTVTKVGQEIINLTLDGTYQNQGNLIPLTSTPKTLKVTYAAGMFTVPAYKGSTLRATFCDAGNNCPSVTPVLVSTIGTNTVSFNANGGEGTMSDSTQTGTQSLPTNTFSKPGFEFAGWATSLLNANRQIITYTDAQLFEYGGSNITLYAAWRVVGSTASSDETLATTGTNSSPLLGYAGGLGIALLVLGGVMVAARRMQKA